MKEKKEKPKILECIVSSSNKTMNETTFKGKVTLHSKISSKESCWRWWVNQTQVSICKFDFE